MRSDIGFPYVDETIDWFVDLGITPVRELYRGIFDIDLIKDLAKNLDTTKYEGFVVRVTDAILYERFDQLVCKWVRKGHVVTDKHWMNSEIVPNGLK